MFPKGMGDQPHGKANSTAHHMPITSECGNVLITAVYIQLVP